MTAEEFDRLAAEERSARALARAVSEYHALPKPERKTRRSAGRVRSLSGTFDEVRAALFRAIVERAVADGAEEAAVYRAIQCAAVPR